MFMNITTHPYHLTQFKLCCIRNSAHSVESYVADHIRTAKILFYNLFAAGHAQVTGILQKNPQFRHSLVVHPLPRKILDPPLSLYTVRLFNGLHSHESPVTQE